MYKFEELEECLKCGSSFWEWDNTILSTGYGTPKQRRINKEIRCGLLGRILYCGCMVCGWEWQEQTKDAD
jgi:hypothetical protein